MIDKLEMPIEMFAEAVAIENSRLRAALESIAENTCCDRCQEAVLVARAALRGEALGRVEK